MGHGPWALGHGPWAMGPMRFIPVPVHTGSRLTEPGSTVPGKVHKFHVTRITLIISELSYHNYLNPPAIN